MNLFDRLLRKRNLLRELLTEEAAQNFVKAFYRQSPESPFKVGDTIHSERFGIPLGPFEITGLKIGGQAVIYTVLADHGSSIYALKTFQNWCYGERGMFERFLREAEIMIDLGRHPNLLGARAVFSINGRPYILLDYVPGSSLRHKLGSAGLPIQDAIRYAIELCRGLAHAQLVLPTFIHRDIKPDNCLVTNDGVLKIGDFGQAKTTNSNVVNSKGGSYHATAPGSPFGSKTTLADHWGAGTPEYMAPEQFRTDSEQDVRTDVYSFGVMLFELLTGDVPFTAQEHEEFFEKHSGETPADLRTINRDIPGPLCDLVGRCLAKSKEERPNDFSQIEEELQRIRLNLLGTRLPSPGSEVETAGDSFNHGFSLLQFQRNHEAIGCFERATRDACLTAPAALFKGAALAVSNRLEDAEQIIDLALKAAPRDSLALNEKGLLFGRRNQFAEAIQFFDRALVVDSKFVRAINNKAACLTQLGQLDGAISALEKSLAIEPLQNAAFRNLGAIHQRMNQPELALESYLKAVAADPRDTESLVQLSNELARAGRYAEAIAYLERAVWLAEGKLNRETLGRELIELLQSGSAIVLSLDCPDDSTIFQWFTVAAHLNCLDSSSVSEVADQMIAGFPRWRSWQKAELAKCLVALLERSESGYQLREVRHSIGRMFYGLGRYDYSGAVFASLVDLDSEDAPSLYYLGACNEKEGNEASALEFYQRALRCDPTSPNTREAIARLGIPLGLSAKAGSGAMN